MWERLHALELRAEDKKALALPGYGGHLLTLEDSRGPRLRAPSGLADYLMLPEAFGLPVLFPPNRIEGNRFSARGREYRLPANRPGGLFIHGFLFERPWRTERVSTAGGAAELEMSFEAGEGGELFPWFPHPFRARLVYRLNGEGLFQTVAFENRGSSPMPFMLGFHSAFALPGRDRDPESYRITIPIGDALQGSRRSEPDPASARFRTGRVLKRGEAVGAQFLAEPSAGPRETLIENLKTGSRLRYRTGGAYGYWMLWNQGGDDSFLCVEPQTCAVNAANLHEERDLFGFRMLGPGETFSAASSILLD
jgi:aldose 1-epimerase